MANSGHKASFLTLGITMSDKIKQITEVPDIDWHNSKK